MKIKFKKKILYTNLVLAIIWTGLGTFNILGDENLRWSDYGLLVVSLLYFGRYLHDFKNHYLTIENGTIRKNGFYGFRKKINLNEINWIKKFANDYTLKTETKELKINTGIIEEKSLSELNEILTKLNLPSEKTPFSNTDNN